MRLSDLPIVVIQDLRKLLRKSPLHFLALLSSSDNNNTCRLGIVWECIVVAIFCILFQVVSFVVKYLVVRFVLNDLTVMDDYCYL